MLRPIALAPAAGTASILTFQRIMPCVHKSRCTFTPMACIHRMLHLCVSAVLPKVILGLLPSLFEEHQPARCSNQDSQHACIVCWGYPMLQVRALC